MIYRLMYCAVKIELIQGFMAVLVICKFDKNLIKNAINIVCTMFSGLWSTQGQVTLMPIVKIEPFVCIDVLSCLIVNSNVICIQIK